MVKELAWVQKGVNNISQFNQRQLRSFFNRACGIAYNNPEVLFFITEHLLKIEFEKTIISREEVLHTLEEKILINDPRAMFLRGRIYESSDMTGDAEALYKNAIDKGLAIEVVYPSLSKLVLGQERWAEAESYLTLLVEMLPNNVEHRSNLAITFLRQNELDKAEKEINLCFIHKDKVNKNTLASLHLNRGTVLQEQGKYSEAKYDYEKCLAIIPNHARAFLNLGVIALQNRNYIEAEKYFKRCLKINPEERTASVNLAGIYLSSSNEEVEKAGWELYEKRLTGTTNILTFPNKKIKRWSGEDINGTLLLVHEQGLGDTFQFIRYAKLLKADGISCEFQGPNKLHKLLLDSDLVQNCISDGERPGDRIEYWTPMMSVPLLYQGIDSDTGNEISPYFRVSQDCDLKWKKILGKKGGQLRIALHWQGNPEHEFTISRGRSFLLKQLEPLSSIINLEWISLQKGLGSEQAFEGVFKDLWHKKQNIIDETWSFTDTAAILNNCDLLISSDSGLAHLAGGLGLRVWLLLPWISEWRWGRTSKKSRWYSNHRLLRQSKKGDWNEPISRVRNMLSSSISNQFNNDNESL